jgi:hypothetical protein
LRSVEGLIVAELFSSTERTISIGLRAEQGALTDVVLGPLFPAGRQLPDRMDLEPLRRARVELVARRARACGYRRLHRPAQVRLRAGDARLLERDGCGGRAGAVLACHVRGARVSERAVFRARPDERELLRGRGGEDGGDRWTDCDARAGRV